MISAAEVLEYIEKSGYSDGTIAREMNVTPARFAQYKESGIASQYDIRAFEIMRNNLYSSLSFDFKDVLNFQERMGYRDVDMCLTFGINKDAYRKMKTGNQKPTQQFRKLFRAAALLESAGYDVYQNIALQ